jgi:hypothetical protein
VKLSSHQAALSNKDVKDQQSTLDMVGGFGSRRRCVRRCVGAKRSKQKIQASYSSQNILGKAALFVVGFRCLFHQTIRQCADALFSLELAP